MADSAALRARRSRRHRAGDHSLCHADAFCRTNTAVPIRATAPASTMPGLGERGQVIWQQARKDMAGALQVTLLLEACRIADRLDVLDRQLHGHDWLRFRHDESGAEVTVYVDRVLAEAREQATALKGIVVELARSTPKQVEPTGGGGLADLTAKIAARRAATSG